METCHICDKNFTSKPHLKRHRESVHLGIRKFKCGYCDKAFVDSRQVKRHTNSVHLKLKPHTCDICNKAFASPTNLKSHINNVHNVDNGQEANLKCDFCESVYTNELDRALHVVESHANQVF